MALISKLLTAAPLSLLVLALLSPRSRKARLYLNTILYVGSMGFCSFLGIIISVLLAVLPLPGNQRLNINYYVARSFYLLTGTLIGTRFIVEGREHLDTHPAVLVGNHQSSMDIAYLGAIFPKHASIMAKKELRYAPLLGQWMWLSGAVFVNRASRTDAFKTFEYVGSRMKKNKLSLWIFPEGTRSKLPVPDLLPFKMGAFHLSLQSGVPIVPVVCENYFRFFDSKTRFESGTIRIRVLPPISPANYTKETVHDFANHVREEMIKVLKELDAEADRFDTTSLAATQPPSSSGDRKSLTTAPNNVSAAHPSGSGLGGVARLFSYLVGTGSGHDASKDVARARAKLAKEGKGQGDGSAKDFGLVSEKSKAEASGVASAAPQQRRTGTSGSGTSEEIDESGAVVVKRPSAEA